ncbi:MAG: MFS transporter [Lachnospiraceae bacterium]|nr:MFS transporter [Lachnospiraceae bacterium]
MNKKSNFKELQSFLILWSSQTVSSLGTAMTEFALIIWVYGQTGNASSVTLLTICSFLPTIVFRFIAGTIADNWDKKHIMLIADLAAACGTLAIFVLYAFSALQTWHIYVINLLLSFMNAFQSPASYVATSLLVPKEHYTRVGGLQAFSGSVISILAPALGSIFLTVGGIPLVLLFDLISFAIAFFSLLIFIKLPTIERKSVERKESFVKSCMTGVIFLRDHAPLLHMVLFFNVINFLAKIGNDGMLSPFVLSRTDHSQNALGMVQTAVSLGILAGSLIVTFTKPVKNKTRVIFIGCAITCFGNVVQSLTHTPLAWSIAAFISYLSAAILNANLDTVMRTHVPIDMQGRVFSAKDTLQNCTIPLGLFLGGILADYVFEPFMTTPSSLQRILGIFFGSGKGAGISVMFFGVGILGSIISITRLRKPIYKDLN